MGFPSDLEIARGAQLRPLGEIAVESGIPADCLELYGEGTAKVRLDAIDAMADRPRARYVVVTAITPTPLGEPRPPLPSAWAKDFPTLANGPPSPSGNPPSAPPSASRAAQRAAATHRLCPWSCCTCI